MRFGSVCSGVECARLAFPKDWEYAFSSEIEPYPCAVLKSHYPDVPNLGDMNNITMNEKGEITNGADVVVRGGGIDLLCGGTPCTDVSVAGKRAGMVDGETRSGLAFQYKRLAYILGKGGKPVRWLVWENVPGVLSSDRGGTSQDSSQDSRDGKALKSQSEDGETLESCQMQLNGISVLRGECLTLNLPEHPCSPMPFLKEDVVCGLSDILETGDPRLEYFLSPKASSGITRRAEKRGKSLPEILQLSLVEQIAAWKELADLWMKKKARRENKDGLQRTAEESR